MAAAVIKARAAVARAVLVSAIRASSSCMATSSPAASTAFSKVQSRKISDFSYVRPGPVPITRHRVRWRESERHEVWKHETIPYVDPGLPAAAKGRLANFWEDTMQDVEGTLEKLQEGSKSVYFVAGLQEALQRRGNAEMLTPEEWKSLLTPATSEELKSYQTRENRAEALFSILEQAERLVADAQGRAQDAAESGETDLSVPILADTREQLQQHNNKNILISALQLAKKLSVLTTAMDADMTPHERVALRRLLDNATTVIDYSRLKSLGSFETDHSRDISKRELTPMQRANMNHFATYEEERADLLAHRDRVEVIPRKRLPSPLHSDAPNRQLEDVARVIDSNPSFSEEDKKYILQHYADAVTGKTEQAFDWSAEKAAIVDPQPQWDSYDPARVKLQDDFIDAAKGQGKFSAMRGYAVDLDRVTPASIGEVDSNPERRPLDAEEEVALAMAAYDKDIKAKVGKITDSITAALSASLGVPTKKPARQADAAAAASKPQTPTKGGKGDSIMRGVSAPAGMSEEEAAKVVHSFFKKYMAGERVPLPQPPLDGPRKEIPTPAAPPAPAKGKEKAKGKK